MNCKKDIFCPDKRAGRDHQKVQIVVLLSIKFESSLEQVGFFPPSSMSNGCTPIPVNARHVEVVQSAWGRRQPPDSPLLLLSHNYFHHHLRKLVKWDLMLHLLPVPLCFPRPSVVGLVFLLLECVAEFVVFPDKQQLPGQGPYLFISVSG